MSYLSTSKDLEFLKIAVEQAKKSLELGGFPAGAIIVKDGKILSKATSLGSVINDPTSHAEIAAIREACKILGTSDLEGATLYESLSSCAMCFSAANWAGIGKIISGCKKTSDMVEKEYYEGDTEISKLNNQNKRKIELVYLPDFEKESLELIKEYEKQF